MEKFKKILRLTALGVMMLLTTVGIGLTGGAPIPSTGKREDTPNEKIEMVEKDRNQDEKETLLNAEKLG